MFSHGVKTLGGGARVVRVAVLGALVSTALLAPSSTFGAAKVKEHEHNGPQEVDTRKAKIAPTAAQRAAAETVAASVRWNEHGTPRSLFTPKGLLKKGIDAPGPEAAAKRWIEENKGIFKLASADSLKVEKSLRLGAKGHAVVLRQQVGALDVAPEGHLTLGLVQTPSGFDVAYASSEVVGDAALNGSATLSLEQALARAAAEAGRSVSVLEIDAGAEAGEFTTLSIDGVAEQQLARLVAFATDDRGVVPAYETYFNEQRAGGELIGLRQFIDARTGDLLLREDVVDEASDNPTWLVFPSNPPAALDEFPWNYPSADTRDLWCWLELPSCKLVVANQASPREWDVDGHTQAPTFTTLGNNANTTENWDGGAGTNYRPVSPARDYVYPWTNVWFEDRCDPANLTVVGVSNDINAAVVNLFAMHNRMHDWTYNLGFTEANWNAQMSNYGRGGAENDPVRGRAQSAARTGGFPTYSGRDNANMSTQPDGTPSITNMFVWQPLAGSFYAPCVDGDYDMSVIAHEYGHMVENRMIGKGNRRSGDHAGAMGESAGDLMAVEYQHEYGFVPAGGGDNPSRDATTSLVGRYVTGNDDRGIRNYDMGFPQSGHYPEPGRYSHVNPLNFGDVGYDIVGPQVHADGEIWSATNFGIRSLLLDRYPSQGRRIQQECADGERPAEECPGNRRWIQIMFDAFLLMPTRPTFLDARDAFLAADLMRFGGANQDLLWLGFAQRGFGQNAVTTSANDSDPLPDFESPFADEATLTFQAVSADTGAPVPAEVFVGHYERGVSPIADTDPATGTTATQDNIARFVPNGEGYEFVATASGYGHVRFTVKPVQAGDTRTITIRMPTNWASSASGGVASGDGTRHGDLIDDTEGTNWESTGVPVEGRQVLVRLGSPQTVSRIKVSAFLQPGQSRFTALREFEVYACTEGGDRQNATCDPAIASGFKRIVKSESDAFPGDPPRPVGPELLLRTWEAGGGATATHVLIRVLANQCTGNSAFHGEQDNDPQNHTDCRTGTPPPLPPRNLEVRIAELQVFSAKPEVDGATQED